MKYLTFTAILLAALAAPAYAQQQAADHSAHGAAPATTTAALTDGEVRRVDKDAQKLTIRHGPIQNLGMPAMTMVFQVIDPAILNKISAGDKIRFAADKVGGQYRVTRIEPVK